MSANDLKRDCLIKRRDAGKKRNKNILVSVVMGATIKVFCATFICLFYIFFFHALAFFIKHPRFSTDKIFYSFYSFYPAKRFFNFFFFSSLAPSHYPFLRNCYHRPPNEDDVCTNAWQQEEKKPLYTNKNDKKDEK